MSSRSHEAEPTAAPRTLRPRRALIGVVAALVLPAVLSGCGGTTASPIFPAPTPAAPTRTPAAVVATPAPTLEPTAKPTPTPREFSSNAYGYGAVFPGAWRPQQATKPWDGTTRIDSTGPYTDQVPIPGSILLFVYGAPTALDLDAYAAKTQADMVSWHACPTVPTAVADVALDGAPGRLHEMTCLGLFVQKLMVVRAGKGLVVNMLAPPARTDEARELLRDVVAQMTWPA
jgi:hypothetical protein